MTEELLRKIYDSALTNETKHEIIEWLWAQGEITDLQYQRYIVDPRNED